MLGQVSNRFLVLKMLGCIAIFLLLTQVSLGMPMEVDAATNIPRHEAISQALTDLRDREAAARQ